MNQETNPFIAKQTSREPNTSEQDSKEIDSKEIDSKEIDLIEATKEVRKAHHVALKAQKARVSRRLLLAERSRKLSVVCPETGIVSLLEVPAIPKDTLVYSHPLSELNNARGIAQQGLEYLRKLDTQTLSGILIVLAGTYELFRYQPADSGAQKNAILRTAGKDLVISAIILIETYIHSRNIRFLPKLSLIFDPFTENYGVEERLSSYLKELTKAIEKPDIDLYDSDVKPKKIGRPLYIREVEKAERKVSFLARQEIARAKKEFETDKKNGKIIISGLFTTGKISVKMKAFISQLLSEDGLLVVARDLIDMLVAQKLSVISDPKIPALCAILKKDRKILTMEVSEIEELMEEKIEKEIEKDDPKPGQEASIEDPISPPMTQEEYDMNSTVGIDSENGEKESQKEPEPPIGLSFMEKILWIKKWKASVGVPRTFVQNKIDAGTTYVPSATKQKLGEKE